MTAAAHTDYYFKFNYWGITLFRPGEGWGEGGKVKTNSKIWNETKS